MRAIAALLIAAFRPLAARWTLVDGQYPVPAGNDAKRGAQEQPAAAARVRKFGAAAAARAQPRPPPAKAPRPEATAH
jgi:hypothetical protein